ncbi:MAG: hypothetical protein HY648_11780 [Acidobacteria bacterium]|nr:hypothetical protein [Acidobacteriota bacterium]
MFNVSFNRPTHASRLERWLGVEAVEQLSKSVQDWYGPPIAIAGVPGAVWACKGGDFRGLIGSGGYLNAVDFAVMRLQRIWRNAARRQAFTLNTGFASLSDLIAEATAGKKQDLAFNKVGSTGVIASTNQLWQLGPMPAAGAPGAAPPGGTAHSSANTGALFFNNPSSPDTTHFVSGFAAANFVNTLLLYDRLFSVAKTINSTGAESVTGVPTRYQNTVAGSADSAEGNFLFMPVGLTAYANTAHNWTVCTYLDEGGNASTLPSLAGNPGAVATIVHRLDMPVGTWFAPLASGDRGVQALTQMQCSALVATGLLDFVIGHPIAWMPIPIVNLICIVDGINTAFNLTRVFDSACLSFLEITKPATSATTYNGSISIVSG